MISTSSGPAAATSSASAMTWVGSRRSMPTTLSRSIQSALSSSAEKRRTASCGKRVVIVVCAPSRSSRSAMYMPILARPPVSSARLPREVGALVALGVRHRGAGRAQRVVERVDQRVVVLADVAAARVDQLAREGTVRLRDQRDAERLVVDAERRAGRRRLGHAAVVRELGLALGRSPVTLEGLVHVGGGPLDLDVRRIVLGHLVQLARGPAGSRPGRPGRSRSHPAEQRGGCELRSSPVELAAVREHRVLALRRSRRTRPRRCGTGCGRPSGPSRIEAIRSAVPCTIRTRRPVRSASSLG